MTERVNDIVAGVSLGAAAYIDWTPKGPAFTYSTGLAIHSSPDLFYTPIGEELTFTGSVTYYDAGKSASIWEWNMGDETTLWGQTVTHTYLVPNASTQVSLKITNNYGEITYSRKQVYLKTIDRVVVYPGITVVSTV